eukprot:scaffold56350_cov52-Prasinocladus_malaysianus.AAC.2
MPMVYVISKYLQNGRPEWEGLMKAICFRQDTLIDGHVPNVRAGDGALTGFLYPEGVAPPSFSELSKKLHDTDKVNCSHHQAASKAQMFALTTLPIVNDRKRPFETSLFMS